MNGECTNAPWLRSSMDRASACHAEGCGFESRRSRPKYNEGCMRKLPLRARRLMQKHMRTIRHVGLRDARRWMVPVFVDHLLNTACWRYADAIIAQRTRRKKIEPSVKDWE